jgi:hypothetical protein
MWTSNPPPVVGASGYPFVKLCLETPGSTNAIVAFTYPENLSKMIAAAGEPPQPTPEMGHRAFPPTGIKLKLLPPCVPEPTIVIVHWLQQPTYYLGQDVALIENSPLVPSCWECLGWSY